MTHKRISGFLFAVLSGSWVLLAFWLFAHPASITSEDAYFFQRSLTRYSILDFSPHFPGYPGFVALGRAALGISERALDALLLTTRLIALSIPPIGMWVVWSTRRDTYSAIASGALLLTMPLLPALALSGLSDGAGILSLIIAFGCLARCKSPKGAIMAGCTLGIALSMRPSLGPVALICLGAFAWRDWPLTLWACLSTGMVGFALLVFLVAQEGMLIFHEAARFTYGHMYVWGNTSLTTSGGVTEWAFAIWSHPWLTATMAIQFMSAIVAIPKRLDTSEYLINVGYWAALIWTILFQNPDNLRHLAPVLCFGALSISLGLSRSSLGPFLASLAVLVGACTWGGENKHNQISSPLDTAITTLNASPCTGIVVTDIAPIYLRTRLTRWRVYEANAWPQALTSTKNQHIVFLSRQPISADLDSVKIIQARILGETPIYVVSDDISCAVTQNIGAEISS